ncbi:MAG: PaaI family thioesterase [Pararhodobacter sp.]|nr:PaaI family thioesterase [Pararhodobacter sp.]
MTTPFTAQRPEDMPDRDTVAGMSGLEFLQAMRDGRLAGPPMAATLGFSLHSVKEGVAVFRGAPAFAHLNPMGAVHGGWYGAVLDSALGCAVASRLPVGRGYTTLEFKVNLIRALPIGMVVDCVGRASHVGRSTGVAEGEIRGVEDGRLYATGSTTCLVFGG